MQNHQAYVEHEPSFEAVMEEVAANSSTVQAESTQGLSVRKIVVLLFLSAFRNPAKSRKPLK